MYATPGALTKWVSANVIFIALPIAVKWLIGSANQPAWVTISQLLGNAELALVAAAVSSSALLDLYLIDRRNNEAKANVFVGTLVVALVSMAVYGFGSQVPYLEGQTNSQLLAWTSIPLYIFAAACSFYGFSLAEGEKVRGRIQRRRRRN